MTLTTYQKGIIATVASYVCWGLFPLYWHPLGAHAESAAWLLAQRVLWSAVFCVICLIIIGQGGALIRLCRQPKTLLLLSISSVMLAINWLAYLYAVTHNHILDAGLGYFISPLVIIALAHFFLGEYLSRPQKIAVTLALVGVLWLIALTGHVPWVALGLAFSWAIYGLLRKRSPIGTLLGLGIEALLMLPAALIYFYFFSKTGIGGFLDMPTFEALLVVGTGPSTTLPLILFAMGAQRVNLNILGMLQYLNPSMQMLLGIFIFSEPFDGARMIGYSWVWLGVAVFIFGNRYWREKTLS